MDDFSWGTTRVTADDPNNSVTAITPDTMDEEQGGGGAIVSNKASTKDTLEEEGGSFEADEPNKASTDKVIAIDKDEEAGCQEIDKSVRTSLAEALGAKARVIESGASASKSNDCNRVGGSTSLNEEERMDSFLYDNLDSSTSQLNVEQREILTVEKNAGGARAMFQRGGTILKGKVALAFGSSSKS